MNSDKLYELAVASLRQKRMVSPKDIKEDILRATKINRMLSKWYTKREKFNVKIVISHIVVLFNEFDPDFVFFLLEHRCKGREKTLLNTILVFMGRSWDFIDVSQEFNKHLVKEME